MDKLHINFYELSDNVRQEIVELIMANYLWATEENKSNSHTMDKSIKKLMELNNAGIDIDIFKYMNK